MRAVMLCGALPLLLLNLCWGMWVVYLLFLSS